MKIRAHLFGCSDVEELGEWKGEGLACSSGLKVLITLVGCRVTPAHIACSLKAAAPKQLLTELGQVSVFIGYQDLKNVPTVPYLTPRLGLE